VTDSVVQLGAAAFAFCAALWAGLLALAQEAPTMARTLGDQPASSRGPLPAYRAIHVARVALLVVAAAAASETVQWWSQPPLTALASIGVTLALLYLMSESIPRGLGVLAPKVSESIKGAAQISLTAFTPLMWLASTIDRWMTRLTPARSDTSERFGPEHRDMLVGVFALGETTVSEAMTPRLDIVALDVTASWREAVDFLARGEHVRVPVYKEDLDSVVGIIYAKDLTPAIAGVTEIPALWQEFIRPAQFVPESKSLTAQLRDFQKGPSLLAIVVDEFGGTSGLITLEDVLEEVVGEIHGEYDVDPKPPVEREGDDRFWVEGSFALDDLSELLGAPVEREEVTTLGGLIYAELGRVPEPGEEMRIDGFRVVVEQVVKRRIKRVYFERMLADGDDGPMERPGE
jgi:CBS domain containing-hemolysin-like protein